MGKTVEKKIYEKPSRHLPTNFTYRNRSAINSSQAENKQHFRIVFIGHDSILIKQGRSKRPIVLTSSLRIEDENCFKNIRSELTLVFWISFRSLWRFVPSTSMKKLILGLAKLFIPNQLARQLRRKQSKQRKKKFRRISEVNYLSVSLNFHLLFLNNWFWI